MVKSQPWLSSDSLPSSADSEGDNLPSIIKNKKPLSDEWFFLFSAVNQSRVMMLSGYCQVERPDNTEGRKNWQHRKSWQHDNG